MNRSTLHCLFLRSRAARAALVACCLTATAARATTPGTADDYVTTDEDTEVTFNVLSNDYDADGDTIILASFSPPAHGQLVSNGDGSFTYTPNQDFSGTDSFEYLIRDNPTAEGQVSRFNEADVHITVRAVDDPPTLIPDIAATDRNQPVTVDVLLNDRDVDSDVLTIIQYSQPGRGQVVLVEADGRQQLRYTPDTGYTGPDSFTYTVYDGENLTDPAVVSVSVLDTNRSPEALDDTRTIDEDSGPTTITVLDNDADPDGGELSVVAVSQPPNGRVTITAGGAACQYTPDSDHNGSDSFTYTIEDAAGARATADVTVSINPVNDPPVGVDDAFTTDEETRATWSPAANDTEVDGDTLAVAAVTVQPPAGGGSVVVNADGTVTYTPGAPGRYSFTYQVSDKRGGTATAVATVTVTDTNAAPEANPDYAVITAGNPVTINVLDNDEDPEDDDLTIATVSFPADGSIAIGVTEAITYTPDPGFEGIDSFTYTITDGELSDTATVTIIVNPPQSGQNRPPTGVDDLAITTEDNAVTISVLDNDTDADGDPLALIAITVPANGDAVPSGTDAILYTPNPDFTGLDTFTYSIADDDGGTDTNITVQVYVAAENDPPTAAADAFSITTGAQLAADVTANDSDPEGTALTVTLLNDAINGTLSLNDDGTFTYTADDNYVGIDGFTYQATDGVHTTGAATVFISVQQTVNAPVAADDAYTATEDTPLSVAAPGLLFNDSDADDDTLTVSLTSLPAHGSVSLNPNGSFTFTPGADAVTEVSFSYRVSDGSNTDTATVTIAVTAENDPPEAADDWRIVPENSTAVEIAVLANDTDVDGNLDTTSANVFAALDQPANGIVAINGTVLLYTPDANFTGRDTFTYTIVDDDGATDTATVTVTITPADTLNAPVAVDDAYTATEDTPLSVAAPGLLFNDSDADDDTLTVSLTSLPAHGSVSLSPNGSFTFTPGADQTTPVTFDYRVSDGSNTDTATVTIAVTAVNDPPQAADDWAVVDEDAGATEISVLSNDSDADGDQPSVVAVTQPANGTAVITDTGAVTYRPDADFTGRDTFSYTIVDPVGATDTATVTVTVNPDNDAPVAAPDNATTTEDAQITIDVLDNDRDPDGDTLTITAVGNGPAKGSVAAIGDAVVFTPDGTLGRDTFTYTVSDGTATATATVTVYVNPGNQPPVAIDDVAVLDENDPDGSIDITPLANDHDPEGATLVLLDLETLPSLGEVSIDADADTITYTRVSTGLDHFTYTVSDGINTATATITVFVNPIQPEAGAPTANDDVIETEFETAIPIRILDNDGDPNGDALTLHEIPTAPENGTATPGLIDDNGDVVQVITYTPDDDFVGLDTFTYTISDGVNTAAATVYVFVNPAPAQPAPAPSPARGWSVELGDAGKTLDPVYLGMADDASDRYSAREDWLALDPQPAAAFRQDGLLLYRDVRQSADSATWTLQVAPAPARSDRTLTWDPDTLPPGGLWIWETAPDGDAAAPPVDMAATGSLFLAGGNAHTVTIAYGSVTMPLQLAAGWNLVSTPVHLLQDTPTALAAQSDAIVAVWAWQGGAYDRPRRIEPGRGYWILCDAPCRLTLLGTPVTDPLRILPAGWSLIGPLATSETPDALPLPLATEPSGALFGEIWAWDGAFTTARSLQPGHGYWLYLRKTALADLGGRP